jgi:hypothetical protein
MYIKKEQFFTQMKHYLKLYKSKNYNELTVNLKKLIIKITLFMLIIKIFIKVRKKSNIENLKFIKLKNWHLQRGLF